MECRREARTLKNIVVLVNVSRGFSGHLVVPHFAQELQAVVGSRYHIGHIDLHSYSHEADGHLAVAKICFFIYAGKARKHGGAQFHLSARNIRTCDNSYGHYQCFWREHDDGDDSLKISSVG